MADVTYLELRDQLSSMLGADSLSDLPPSDQKRLGIYVNQAYRECYLPVDGMRPRWATKKFTVAFASGDKTKDLSPEVIDVERIPELVGEGPLSPFNSPQDEIKARATYSSDFRPIPGRTLGMVPSFDTEEPERGRPLWYWIDQSEEAGGDTKVVPRMNLYPVPNKAYTVEFTANIIPEEMSLDADVPRLPGDVVWDILLPLSQYKLLADPRYNGSNREFLEKSAMEAKKRLKTLAKVQKQNTVRIGIRGGW